MQNFETLYRVFHFKSCIKIFLQRSIFRKNVSIVWIERGT